MADDTKAPLPSRKTELMTLACVANPQTKARSCPEPASGRAAMQLRHCERVSSVVDWTWGHVCQSSVPARASAINAPKAHP